MLVFCENVCLVVFASWPALPGQGKSTVDKDEVIAEGEARLAGRCGVDHIGRLPVRTWRPGDASGLSTVDFQGSVRTLSVVRAGGRRSSGPCARRAPCLADDLCAAFVPPGDC
ncbi:hypothetical protein GCM10027200_33800 [Lentzea nigeriaca]